MSSCAATWLRQAIDICRQTHNFHILVIIADGQVTSERETIAAIEEASYFPLSIIMVGVGDGPWDQMMDFDDRLPRRQVSE
jgi:E3 ubiquitin-protein ligase RGLG